MSKLGFLSDDLDAYRAFVETFSKNITERYCPQLGIEHAKFYAELIQIDRRTIALAAAFISLNGRVARTQILAQMGDGGHAVRALQRLKGRLNVRLLLSVVPPTKCSSLLVAERHVDAIVDWATWKESNRLLTIHGSSTHLQPIQLAATDALLSAFAVPKPGLMDNGSKAQIFKAVINPLSTVLVAPNGCELDHGSLFALAFDLTGVSIELRQAASLQALYMFAAAQGTMIEPLKLFDASKTQALPTVVQKFHDALADLPNARGGIFTVNEHATGESLNWSPPANNRHV